jgi:hypothetical protein
VHRGTASCREDFWDPIVGFDEVDCTGEPSSMQATVGKAYLADERKVEEELPPAEDAPS